MFPRSVANWPQLFFVGLEEEDVQMMLASWILNWR